MAIISACAHGSYFFLFKLWDFEIILFLIGSNIKADTGTSFFLKALIEVLYKMLNNSLKLNFFLSWIITKLE